MPIEQKTQFTRVFALFLSTRLFDAYGAASFAIAQYYDYNIFEVMFWIGFVIAFLGTMSSVAGNATGTRVFGGGLDSQYSSFLNIETLRMERETTDYFKNFKKHAVFDPKVSGASIIISGLVLISLGYFLG